MKSDKPETRWVFFHGGPGLNSEPERRLWQPTLQRLGANVHFWDEPRQNVDANKAFDLVLQSAEQTLIAEVAKNHGAPVSLVGHSFGANIALALADRFPTLVSRLILLAPATQVYTAFLRILRIGHEEALRAQASQAADEIENCLISTSTFPDEPLLRGLGVALAQPGTVLRYWHSLENLQNWAKVIQTPEWAPDADSQLGVLLSCAKHLAARTTLRSNIPVWLGFGAEDEIISRADEVRFLSQRFPIMEQKTFENAGHFVHLEATEALSQWLLSPAITNTLSFTDQSKRMFQDDHV